MARRHTALVTGATYGVGAAIALALARGDFDLAITATKQENLAATMQTLADTAARVVPVALDLRDEPSLAARTGEIVAALGGIDLLVNNAGANLRKDAVDVTVAEWDALMDVNLRGAYFLTQHVARAMIAAGRGGCIVNIASTYALVGAPERSVYGISKAALVGMTRMLAVEWAPHNIRVNHCAGPAGHAVAVARRQGGRPGLYGSDAQAYPAAPAGEHRGSRRRRRVSRERCHGLDDRAAPGARRWFDGGIAPEQMPLRVSMRVGSLGARLHHLRDFHVRLGIHAVSHVVSGQGALES